MSTRILPLLALLPALAACTEVVTPTPETVETAVAESATPVARPTAVPSVPPTPVSTAAAPATRVPAPSAASPLAPPPAAEEASAEVPAAPAAPAAAPTGRLGTTVASLGTTSPGLWLETPLVEAPTQGRIEYNGQSVSVELRPSGGEPGSGSQISLEAMRAIGASLTGLPELTVFGS